MDVRPPLTMGFHGISSMPIFALPPHQPIFQDRRQLTCDPTPVPCRCLHWTVPKQPVGRKQLQERQLLLPAKYLGQEQQDRKGGTHKWRFPKSWAYPQIIHFCLDFPCHPPQRPWRTCPIWQSRAPRLLRGEFRALAWGGPQHRFYWSSLV